MHDPRETLPTMKIKSTDAKSQGEYVEINVQDFDTNIHEKYGVKQAKAPAAPVPTPAPEATTTDVPTPTAAPVPEATPTAAPLGEVNISATARKLAEDNGLDVKTIAGSGQKGLITIADVENALAAVSE